MSYSHMKRKKSKQKIREKAKDKVSFKIASYVAIGSKYMSVTHIYSW